MHGEASAGAAQGIEPLLTMLRHPARMSVARKYRGGRRAWLAGCVVVALPVLTVLPVRAQEADPLAVPPAPYLRTDGAEDPFASGQDGVAGERGESGSGADVLTPRQPTLDEVFGRGPSDGDAISREQGMQRDAAAVSERRRRTPERMNPDANGRSRRMLTRRSARGLQELPRLPEPPRLEPLRTGSIDVPPPLQARRSRRPLPPSPDGLRMGAFVLTGEVEAGPVWTSNRDGNGRNAVGARIAPNLRLVSDWARHELSFTANGEFIAWSRGKRDAKGNAGVALRLDARHDLRYRLGVTYAVDELSTGSDILEHQVDGTAAVEYDHNRLRVTATAGVLRNYHWQDPTNEDYFEPHVSLRGRLRTAPALAVYGEVGADVRLHDANRDPSTGRKRDSKGAYVEAGVELLHGPILEGQMGVRLSARDYDDPATPVFKGVGVNGNITWRPRRTTTITADATFSMEDNGGSGRSRKQVAGLSLEQQLRHGLDLRGRVEGEYSNPEQGNDTLTLRASASLAWQIRRRLWIVPGYDYEKTFVKGGVDSRPEHRVRISLRQRF